MWESWLILVSIFPLFYGKGDFVGISYEESPFLSHCSLVSTLGWHELGEQRNTTMDFSEWNTLPPNCITLGLSVCMDPGSSGMSTNLMAVWKLRTVDLGVKSDGNFQTHIPLSTTFQFLPQAWNSIYNIAQTLNGKQKKTNLLISSEGKVIILFRFGLSVDQGTEKTALGSSWSCRRISFIR